MIGKGNNNISKAVSNIRIKEELSNGKLVPVLQPTFVCGTLRPRRYSTAINNYCSVRDLVTHLEQGKRDILKISPLNNVAKNEEEELLKLTHELVVLKCKDNMEKMFLVPSEPKAMFRQISFKYIKIEDRFFYKCVADRTSIVLLKFKYTVFEDHTTVHFTVFNINRFTLCVQTFQESIKLTSTDELKFDIILRSEILCVFWISQSLASILNLIEYSPTFQSIEIQEDLNDTYRIVMLSDYFRISVNDPEFIDSVFPEKDASKRMTSYYSVHSGRRFISKEALGYISELMFFEHPTDVIYIQTNAQPVWLVLEWLLPEVTVGKLVFFGIADGCVSHIVKEFDFTELFQEYKTFFNTPNERQADIEICHVTMRLFLWISKRHLAIINLQTYELDAMLELKTEKFFDFKNERHEYVINLPYDDVDRVQVFIKKGKDIHHYETFVLPSINTTLKVHAKSNVLKHYMKVDVEKLTILPNLKKELLLCY